MALVIPAPSRGLRARANNRTRPSAGCSPAHHGPVCPPCLLRRLSGTRICVPLLFERCSIDNAFASPRYGFQSRADALTPASSLPNTGTWSHLNARHRLVSDLAEPSGTFHSILDRVRHESAELEAERLELLRKRDEAAQAKRNNELERRFLRQD